MSADAAPELQAPPPADAADPWLALAQAGSVAALCSAWLAVLGRTWLPLRAGLVLLRQADGRYAPAAALPPGRDLAFLADIATDALRQREAVVRHDELGHARLAYPLQAGGEPAPVHGAVVLDIGPADESAIERALQLTHWGVGWLLDMLARQELHALRGRSGEAAALLDLLLAVLAEDTPVQAAQVLAARLKREFGCAQVQVARVRGLALQRLAVSDAAWVDDRAEQLHLALAAMHEAFDQRQRIHWPPAEGAAGTAAEAHRRASQALRDACLCSLPLASGRRVVGVLLLEREHPFDAAEATRLDALALALAPVLDLQDEVQRPLPVLLAQRSRRALGRLASGRHLAWKLGALAGVVALAVLAVLPGPHRVTAQALVEGEVQRAAVAPFEGYLRSAPARAGDTVKAGQVLAVLDDKDLLLERARWESELELALRKEREAMAKANRVDQRLAAAQANQARAQLELVLARLARVQVTAPFDAVVVKGDLSQLLGTPLEQGKVLFELAPLQSWRVVLKVDERDIGHLQVGAQGELVLASLPQQRWPLRVSQLTPVSVAENGANHFRVEARLEGATPQLRPNMEGVAKVVVGERSLLWLWTHPLWDWLRLAWWRWAP